MSPRPERRRALREAIEDLSRYAGQWTQAEFLASRDAQRMVLQALYVAAQACLDEALESCKARGLDAPTYRDAFLVLAQAGTLDPELAARLADWASFRNVLAHFYPVIDLRRVYAALSELEDLAAFERWLEEEA